MPFKPGQSGNPGGRPKVIKPLQEACREFTMEAIAALKYWARQKSDPSAALKAIEMLLQRGYGKPVSVSQVEHKGEVSQKIVTDTEAARLIAFTLAKGVQEKDKESEQEAKTLQ